jgi:hypothetical protein
MDGAQGTGLRLQQLPPTSSATPVSGSIESSFSYKASALFCFWKFVFFSPESSTAQPWLTEASRVYACCWQKQEGSPRTQGNGKSRKVLLNTENREREKHLPSGFKKKECMPTRIFDFFKSALFEDNLCSMLYSVSFLSFSGITDLRQHCMHGRFWILVGSLNLICGTFPHVIESD